MLASCVVFLKVNREVLVPPSMGQVLHAFFLDRVRLLNPDLAGQLHSPTPLKPFSVSPLLGRVIYEDNRWRLFPGEAYAFRVTSIDPEFSRWLTDSWAPSLSGEIGLAGAGLEVAGWSLNTDAHSWAGSTSYEELYSNIISCPGAGDRITIEFYSPTTFRARGSNYPLPDPQKVFLNLLQKWNYYSPINLGDNFIDFIRENVFPGSYKLQTRIMHFDKYKQVGFTGTCTFRIRRQEEDIIISVLHMLAEYAFYAGVGYKTTMGMGQSRAVHIRR
ncbi:CRISPR-associated protein Cas6 [Desulfofarcimen acetoxidans DSM 771]|uniref:CRISPR-associated protein Cas6 n=1 Tax=Desulfofarcimen acetoxidans (strain ATCC 49208 / DSM 771 / KCTC 5769 / VKM B-1644 / 5575) TaxID=485916 RepID=C8W2P2_DESAS|nr:CRISPR-associated endoribonuclease Cas6 [Desulfofarcimen acetoxidans]ACV63726.1 CRISPR-associated protein Cas6 [Desulfofarcimen acetoxidans DSM 771]